MKWTIVLSLFFLSCLNVFSQNFKEKEMKNSMLIGMAFSPAFGKNQIGINIEFKHTIKEKYVSGLYFFSKGINTSDSFGLSVKQPVVNLMEIGWNNGVRIYDSKYIKISASLSNNLCLLRLGDNSEKTSFFTGRILATTSKEIRTEYKYSIVPCIEGSIKMYSTLYLTPNIKYRQAFGSTFTNINTFNGFIYGVGLTFFLE